MTAAVTIAAVAVGAVTGIAVRVNGMARGMPISMGRKIPRIMAGGKSSRMSAAVVAAAVVAAAVVGIVVVGVSAVPEIMAWLVVFVVRHAWESRGKEDATRDGEKPAQAVRSGNRMFHN